MQKKGNKLLPVPLKVLYYNNLFPVVVPSSEVVSAAATAAVATRAFGSWFCYRYSDVTSFEILLVKLANGSLTFVIVLHFHETETSGFSGEFVGNNFGG